MGLAPNWTTLLGKAPEAIPRVDPPVTANEGKLRNVQGFLTGTLDTVSRFVSSVRSRGTTEVVPRAPAPEPTRAQGVSIPTRTVLVALLVGLGVLLVARGMRRMV